MNIKRHIALFFFIFWIMVSCSENGFFNAGDEITKRIDLAETVNTIEAKKTFEIILVQDTVNYTLVTCGENLFKSLNIHPKGDTLYLDHDLKYAWSRDYKKIKLEMHLKKIPYFNIRYPISISNRDTFKSESLILNNYDKYSEVNLCVDVDYFSIYMPSESFQNYTISGKAKFAELSARGASMLDARNMIIRDCSITHNGSNEMIVNVTDSLSVKMQSLGNVYYVGTPANLVIDEQSSSGKVMPLKGD